MRIRLVGLVVLVALIAAACSNASKDDNSGGKASSSGTDPGITATEIKVGGLAAKTGPLGSQYEPIGVGVQAYLDMVNEQGGVNGRKIKFIGLRDDATTPSRNVAQARALVEQDKVFAIVGVASPLFPAGTYLAGTGVPTFGWNVNPEWSAGPNLFGEKGSYLSFTDPGPAVPFLATRSGAKVVAAIAYTASQSADCMKGMINSYNQFGLKVGVSDASLPFGVTNIDADIQRMKEAGVQFVSTCMDPTGNTLLSRSLKQAGLGHVQQYWPNGYDQETLSKFADLMEGVYLYSDHVPFETPQFSPGMQTFLREMKKRYPNQAISDVVLAGWINADLFVTALKAAGKDVTRKKVVDAINKMTHYTAGDINAGIDWTVQHKGDPPILCSAFIQVKNGKFTPAFGNASTPFTCFRKGSTTLDTVPPPTG